LLLVRHTRGDDTARLSEALTAKKVQEKLESKVNPSQ